jgi:hypothetical protein
MQGTLTDDSYVNNSVKLLIITILSLFNLRLSFYMYFGLSSTSFLHLDLLKHHHDHSFSFKSGRIFVSHTMKLLHSPLSYRLSFFTRDTAAIRLYWIIGGFWTSHCWKVTSVSSLLSWYIGAFNWYRNKKKKRLLQHFFLKKAVRFSQGYLGSCRSEWCY